MLKEGKIRMRKDKIIDKVIGGIFIVLVFMGFVCLLMVGWHAILHIAESF